MFAFLQGRDKGLGKVSSYIFFCNKSHRVIGFFLLWGDLCTRHSATIVNMCLFVRK